MITIGKWNIFLVGSRYSCSISILGEWQCHEKTRMKPKQVDQRCEFQVLSQFGCATGRLVSRFPWSRTGTGWDWHWKMGLWHFKSLLSPFIAGIGYSGGSYFSWWGTTSVCLSPPDRNLCVGCALCVPPEKGLYLFVELEATILISVAVHGVCSKTIMLWWYHCLLNMVQVFIVKVRKYLWAFKLKNWSIVLLYGLSQWTKSTAIRCRKSWNHCRVGWLSCETLLKLQDPFSGHWPDPNLFCWVVQ